MSPGPLITQQNKDKQIYGCGWLAHNIFFSWIIIVFLNNLSFAVHPPWEELFLLLLFANNYSKRAYSTLHNKEQFLHIIGTWGRTRNLFLTINLGCLGAADTKCGCLVIKRIHVGILGVCVKVSLRKTLGPVMWSSCGQKGLRTSWGPQDLHPQDCWIRSTWAAFSFLGLKLSAHWD